MNLGRLVLVAAMAALIGGNAAFSHAAHPLLAWEPTARVDDEPSDRDDTVRDDMRMPYVAGIIGSFAGVPLGFALAVLLPGDPDVGSGAVGAIVAAVWSWLWFRRTKSGIAIAAVVLELTLLVTLIGDMSNITTTRFYVPQRYKAKAIWPQVQP